MDYYEIEGGYPLFGSIKISGAKNSALAIIPATILAPGKYTIQNVPNLKDVETMLLLMKSLGAEYLYDKEEKKLKIDTTNIKSYKAPYELVSKMRASIYVLGPLIARFGEAKVSLPGGCAIGPRPVNLHIDGIKSLSAEVVLEEGYIKARAKKLRGSRIVFPISSVGATANIMMASVFAEGKTIIENAAMEPEIVDLANFLVKMGAKIYGAGSETIEIEGVSSLTPTDYTIIPDRIEAGTFIFMGLFTGGRVRVENCIPKHNEKLIEILKEIGIKVDVGENYIEVERGEKVLGFAVKTEKYPGFPTDLQAPCMAFMTTIPGVSVIVENIFENRYNHIGELLRMGANIEVINKVAIIKGVNRLIGAPVMMTDLRAGAGLVIAALGANGKSQIYRIYHTDRGYEDFEEKIRKLGGKIFRRKG